MATLSVAEAAGRLGVSRRQVQRLVAAGTLGAVRGFGGALVVDAGSVRRATLGRPGRGRPWAADMAWGALWRLSGLDTPWLTTPQRRRLVRLLATVDADRLLVATRNRATTERFAASPQVRDSLRRAVPTGYVAPGRLAELTASYPISRDPDGDVILHVTDFAGIEGRREMPDAVVAADLAASGDPAGLVRLDDLLRGDGDAERTWMTAADVAQAIAEELRRGDEDFAFRMLARGVADLRGLRRPADLARFLAEPPPAGTGDPRWDALLAAAVRRECRRRGLPAPAWTDVPPLRPWWFPLLPSPRLAARTMQRTPVDFSVQGIWLDANALETA